MKAIRNVGLLFLTVAMFILLQNCGPRKYAMKNNEEIFGTWVSEVSHPQKLVMLSNATWEEYLLPGDPEPTYKGTYEIVEKWKDSEGNFWYKELVISTYGQYKGYKAQELDKIDKTGHTWELFATDVAAFDPANFPKEIDRSSNSYKIYQRADK